MEGINQVVKTDVLISAVVKLSPSVLTGSAKMEYNDKTLMEQNSIYTMKQLSKRGHPL